MKLIISRINEWFDTDYPELDVYYVCVKLLEKLDRNRIKGIVYNRNCLSRPMNKNPVFSRVLEVVGSGKKR